MTLSRTQSFFLLVLTATCLLVMHTATYLLLSIRISHEDLTKLSRLRDSFLCLLKAKDVFIRQSAVVPHVCHRTELVTLPPPAHCDMKQKWWYYECKGRLTVPQIGVSPAKKKMAFVRCLLDKSPLLDSILGHWTLCFMFPTPNV